MSDTQGSHRRGAPVPEAYGGEPPARSTDPGLSSWDTEPALAVPVPVPGPRAEDRRAGRRRRAADAEVRDGERPGPAAAPGTGRRRAPAPTPTPTLADAGAPAPGRRARGRTAVEEPPAGTGRRRGPAEPAVPAPAGAGHGRRRAAVPVLIGPAVPAGNWRRIVPQALVVAFLAGGTTAFVAADKSVRLTVDGVPRELHTFAGDVEELLAAEGLDVGPHDLVAPAPGEPLDDGEEVVLRYGRPLRLTLDGQQRQVWTTARTVDGALRQFGIRAEGAYLSAPRTAPVPRAGLALSVRTERSVTFMADGRERTIRTNAATVQEALDQAGITLQGQDTTSVPPTDFPRDGQTVTVLRITGTREVREERIPFGTEKIRDAELFAGIEVVERAGRPGARRVTYSLRTVNGVRQKPRAIADEVVREPVTQLVRVGTRPLPSSVAGADGLNWAALAQCESGGRPSATDASGTYGGLYQFDVRTWQGLGGSGRPQDAPAAEQTYRAKKLYVQRGASPWPHCGRRLTS
ncbi:ubiquitin-like domain-containing protein [Streptomyces yangpuensis]|uniref:Ubiquitin-like domain-containing protein n=2 Tax=Streptomyces yangpuensis TaxID=1648182 RepID=A0ABY5PW10_9ACTN|nr:ubiquitin-like domain-containing protein [Streptomyces yangpuensis]UUY48214.1 ubiquitin-like domain-containing protein [Streptomyces yangpuensis]